MLRYGYDRRLASGVIAASGTLAQIIPPSLVLIVLADQLGRSVGDLAARSSPLHADWPLRVVCAAVSALRPTGRRRCRANAPFARTTAPGRDRSAR
jgi:TRAP-type C4-dicarboxylate transport system permease large subunit